MRTNPLILSLAACALAVGCAPDLKPGPTPDGSADSDGGVGGGSGHVENTDNGDGTFTTRIDARDQETWVYFDFEAKREVTPADPDHSRDWDLSFRRYKVRVDGGSSGAGNVGVAPLPGIDFASLKSAPASGYAADEGSGDADAGPSQLVFEAGDGWYLYDVNTHALSPRNVVYVVRTVEGNYFKVQILGYYDAAGTPGYLSFKWAPLTAPAGSDVLSVDASSTTAWTYLSAKSGVLTIATPATSNDWDLAIRRTQLQTNSGSSGAGKGGARLAPAGATYDETTRATTIGFDSDALLPIAGPPGSGESSQNPTLANWYDYDQTTHVVTPKAVVYLLRTASGEYAKLQLTSYSDGKYTLRLQPIVRSVETVTLAVDASSTTTWSYVSLRAGRVVTVAAPATDGSWDLAIQRTNFQTNSGTSGAGLGGAGDPKVTDLGDIVSSGMASFSADALIPVAGPPGSGSVSGNPILANWYDYDQTTHVVTPKNAAFLVRTADGGDTKLKITTYANGQYSLSWAYAGPGRNDF